MKEWNDLDGKLQLRNVPRSDPNENTRNPDKFFCFKYRYFRGEAKIMSATEKSK